MSLLIKSPSTLLVSYRYKKRIAFCTTLPACKIPEKCAFPIDRTPLFPHTASHAKNASIRLLQNASDYDLLLFRCNRLRSFDAPGGLGLFLGACNVRLSLYRRLAVCPRFLSKWRCTHSDRFHHRPLPVQQTGVLRDFFS